MANFDISGQYYRSGTYPLDAAANSTLDQLHKGKRGDKSVFPYNGCLVYDNDSLYVLSGVIMNPSYNQNDPDSIKYLFDATEISTVDVVNINNDSYAELATSEEQRKFFATEDIALVTDDVPPVDISPNFNRGELTSIPQGTTFYITAEGNIIVPEEKEQPKEIYYADTNGNVTIPNDITQFLVVVPDSASGSDGISTLNVSNTSNNYSISLGGNVKKCTIFKVELNPTKAYKISGGSDYTPIEIPTYGVTVTNTDEFTNYGLAEIKTTVNGRTVSYAGSDEAYINYGNNTYHVKNQNTIEIKEGYLVKDSSSWYFVGKNITYSTDFADTDPNHGIESVIATIANKVHENISVQCTFNQNLANEFTETAYILPSGQYYISRS